MEALSLIWLLPASRLAKSDVASTWTYGQYDQITQIDPTWDPMKILIKMCLLAIAGAILESIFSWHYNAF